MDGTLRETYIHTLNRYFQAFESVHSYVMDLQKFVCLFSLLVCMYCMYNAHNNNNEYCRFIDDLEESVYLQQNLETLFMDADGKQLLVCL